jgi:hypothetical protein
MITVFFSTIQTCWVVVYGPASEFFGTEAEARAFAKGLAFGLQAA